MTEREILLIGGGGHCRSCIEVIEAGGEYRIGGIVLPAGERLDQTVSGYAVVGSDADLEVLRSRFLYAAVVVGQIRSAEVRIRLFEKLESLAFRLPAIRSPHAYVSARAVVEEGTIVMHHAIINAGAVVGKGCIINTKALVEHDASIGNYCHISTGAIVNGGAVVGAQTFVGSNSTIVQNATVPQTSFVKAGCVFKGV